VSTYGRARTILAEILIEFVPNFSIMALASSHLLPFLLLSLTAASWGWRYGDRPYGQSATSTDYSQSAGSDHLYTPHAEAERPPPRINTNTGYGDMGTRPESDAWNRAERPQQSQFDYEESDEGFGKVRTETLDCGKDLYISSNKIIDIQTSVQFGAQLLDGVYSYSFDSCVDACCSYEGCDLALYKVNGESETGKTCYFVHCGLLEHCQMVSNDGFKSGFLIQKPNNGDILDDHSTKQNPDESSSSTTEPPETSSSPSATPTTQTTPTEPDVISTETTEGPDSTTVPVTETHSKPNGTEKPATKEGKTTPTTDTPTQSSSEENISSPVATSNTPPSSSEPSTDSAPQPSGATNTSKVAIDNATRAQKKADNYDKCAKDGCAGSGLIAVSIIGTLIIIVLLVVAVVIGRRVYKLKTRRQYRNVDYLINGMYT
jgi:hypothetical protein